VRAWLERNGDDAADSITPLSQSRFRARGDAGRGSMGVVYRARDREMASTSR